VVVLDYFDVIVHIMRTDVRERYNLEGLWGDAPLVKPAKKPAPKPPAGRVTWPKSEPWLGRAMTNFKQIFKFGWPYLKRYRRRLFLGIMLAVFFGASNASFVWATKTLFDRMAPKDPPPQVIVLNDFDWKSVAARLKNPAPADELSRYLMNEKLAPATRKLLADDNSAVDLPLRQALADDLSQIIQTGLIYEPQRFAGVTLSRDTAPCWQRTRRERRISPGLTGSSCWTPTRNQWLPSPGGTETAKGRERFSGPMAADAGPLAGHPPDGGRFAFIAHSGFLSQHRRLSQRLFHELGK